MTVPDKFLKTPDSLAAVATQPESSTPVPKLPDSQDNSDKSEGSESLFHEKSHQRKDSIHGDVLTATKSNATDASAGTTATNPPSQEKTWKQKLNPLRWGRIPPIPEERMPSREYGASFFSKMFFNWMTPLMITGYKRQLHERDLWSVNPDRNVELLTKRVKAAFKHRRDNGSKRPLLMALYDSFRFEFWMSCLLALVVSLLQVFAPYTLRYLIEFATEAYYAHAEGKPSPPIRNGIGLAIGIAAMQLVSSLCVGHFLYYGMMLGGQIRGVLIGMIYDKSMVISGRAKAGFSKNALTLVENSQDKKKATGKKKGSKKGKPEAEATGWANGRIVNLMSVDTYRIDQACAFMSFVWTVPISCVLTLVLLVINLKYSALAGFGFLVLGVPLLTKAIQSLFRRREAVNKITDKRVSLTQEIVQSVRFVKFFGWETAFLKRLAEIRSREIYSIQLLLALRNVINSVSMSLPIFASMLSFICYRLTDNGLDPGKIFSSLALFNSLRLPLNMLPLVIGQVIDALSSIGRIQDFLMEEEHEEDLVFTPESKHAIEMKQASFTWERTKAMDNGESADPKEQKAVAAADKEAKSQMITSKEEHSSITASSSKEKLPAEEREPFKLQDISFTAGRNELLAVIGTVGCGKSSLLASLAGDMRKTSGDAVLGASRAFCPQYAWIQNSTLQNNIIFGKPMNKSWYKEVIEACALQPDIEMLPNGDLTEIGERGITISGGQKQRLNIARAIYFDADIVLMDDPLSAVDAHVGRHIFENAILGLLKEKCRILATHQLWVLSRCDRVIWMDGGKIRAVDTFSNLMRDEEGFRALMESNTVEKKEDEETSSEAEETDEEDGGMNALEVVKTSPEDRAKMKKRKKQAMLMQQEERAQESVPWSVYASYVRSSGSMLNLPLLALILVLSQGANIGTSLWLSWWTSNKFGYSDGKYIGIYAALGVLQMLFMLIFSVLLTVLGTISSKSMLRDAVTRVLRAPMSFFDTTPIGRITNRFSRDVDVMDNNLTDAIRMFFFTVAQVIAVFILTIAYFYFFVVALVPLYCLYMIAGMYYRSSAREVKRYESVLRSSMFARFSEGLSGVSSIRAYGLRDHFMNDLRKSIDNVNGAYFLTFANQRWLSIRLDIIGSLLVFVVAVLIVTSRLTVNPAIGGLVLSYMLSIVMMLQFSIRQLAEVENGMNAVERLRYYGHELEEEAPLHTVDVRPSWPEKGEIKFDNVEMRYRPNLPLVLKGLSFHIKGGERIGVVGRTGAGKSSVMSTLFRLVEISGGSITIDGLNISTIGLADLRSRLAIIPQDPTLFQGTIRSNLDPFQEHDDVALWSALRQADLVGADDVAMDDRSDSSRIHLDSVVESEGLNFSLGQRQLMALARALVRGSQIIICDEATSSVDMETDDKIQRTMASGFRGRTLLCIAHRLRTIIGYDRICVMDAGQIAEMDTPANLFRIQDGIFRGMCERTNISLADIEAAASMMASL